MDGKFNVVLWSEDGKSFLKRNVTYKAARKAVKEFSENADAMMGEDGVYGVTAYGSEIEILSVQPK